MATKTGYLTVYSPDLTELYGEFADADWTTADTDGGLNHIFTGTAGDGAMDTFRRLNDDGVSHVAYAFNAAGTMYSGQAELLALDPPLVRFETGEAPVRE